MNNGSGKVPHDELNKRKRLILERTEIIEGSREKMKMNNPEQYENITNIINLNILGSDTFGKKTKRFKRKIKQQWRMGKICF